MSYYCDKYPIIEKKSISRDTFSITIYAPEAAKAAHAGQFANISAPGFTLRRPISICEFSRSRGTLRFVFEVRGKGTEAISRLNVGDNLDVLGPLGNGFAIPDSARRAVLVGGGIGVPPMLGLAKKLGDRATAILGFRDYSRIILADEFEKYGAATAICTDDGSVGYHGMVPALMEQLYDKGRYTRCVIIGPMIMMKFASLSTKKAGIPTVVSHNTQIDDSTHMCGACRLKEDRETKIH